MITITGSQTITIERYAEYVDQGATTDDAAETTLTSSSTVNTDVVGTYSVVYSATDGHNNTSTATRTVIVEDTTAPVITITGSQTITIERYAEYVDQGATTDDAAETTLTSSSTVNTDVVGTYSVVYSATDGHNNTSTATRTVIVEDTTAPVITITGSQTITIERYAEYVDQGATTDDAAETTLTSSSTVNTDVVGTYSVVYSATDGHNNTSTATRTVIVEDTTAPVITITGSQTITIERYAEYVDQGATTDDAAETTLTSSSTVNTDVVGTYSVVYSATDGHNNTSTATRTVIVEDTTAPVITITGSQTITIERYAEYVDQGATTDDAAETTLTSSSTVNTDVVGTYSVVYTATDGHNNTSTATRTVIVEDTTAPVITITGSQTITIERYAEYVDQGATTDDAAETTLTSSSTVNTDVVGTYSVVYTATDGHNNTSTATRTVIVEDTTAPVITITGSQTITIERYAEYVDQGATTDDAAETTLTSSSTVNTDVVGTYSVVYTATDGHNNTYTATRTVIVEDTTAPVITITGSQTITIERYAEYVDQGATTDDAAETTLTSSSTVNTDVVGTYSVVYTATDGHNNTSTATRTVIVEDTTAPVITLTGSQTITIERYAEYVDQGATTDDAAETTLTSSSTVNTDVVGTYSVVYTATDGHNNTSTATRTVIVEDTTAPVITITGSQTITIERYAEYVDQGATTDDAAETTLTSSSTVNTDVVGTYSVVYTATDGHNNTSTATRTVIVEDTTAPVITITGSQTITIERYAEYVDQGATTDDAAETTLTSSSTVNTDVVGTYSVVYTATDGHNNTSTATRTVIVEDTTAPVITITGSQTITIERYAEYVDQGATTDDAAETTLTSSSTVNTDVVGTYSVVYTATDGHNNTSTATRTVIVEDTTAPVITITGSQTITIERYAEYVDQGATTDDAAETTLTSSSTVNTDVVGTYSVVYTATDGHNNTSTATRTVIVEDTTAPVITITGSQTITIERYAEYVDQGATTDDAAETTLTSSSTVNTDVVGTYSVVYTATDGHNNTSTATRTVIVEDTTAPVITITGSQTITIERYAEYVDQGATTDDAAETTLTSSSTVNTDVVGTYSVVYTATDGHNNTSTATRTVIVEDTTAPVITITGSQTITIERYAEYVDQERLQMMPLRRP